MSRWPSDMEQDERNGWQLRIYPKRHPSALLEGDWEEYRDQNSDKPLYYNRYVYPVPTLPL